MQCIPRCDYILYPMLSRHTTGSIWKLASPKLIIYILLFLGNNLVSPFSSRDLKGCVLKSFIPIINFTPSSTLAPDYNRARSRNYKTTSYSAEVGFGGLAKDGGAFFRVPFFDWHFILTDLQENLLVNLVSPVQYLWYHLSQSQPTHSVV